MAGVTKISWADGTVNFWVGCAQVGPGCDDCYAIPIAAAMGIGWGDDASRHRTSEATWRNPVRWHEMHLRGQTHMKDKGEWVPVPLWIFGNSLSDFFDNHPDVAPWRAEAWRVIRRSSLLRWIFLTKRATNISRMLPSDWNEGRNYPHVGIVVSVSTQTELNRDVPRLVALKEAHGVRWIGVSVEPQIELISILDTPGIDRIDWIVQGGESRHLLEPRPYHLEWGEQLIAECAALGIPYFHKQVGSNAFYLGKRFPTRNAHGEDPNEWPEHLRAQTWPSVFDGEVPRSGQLGLFNEGT